MTANLPPTKPPAEVHPMQALLEQGGYDMPQRGDIREGTVLQVTPQEIIIDLGLKREGIVPGNDLSRLDKDMLAEIQPGTTWPVYILQPSDREGNLIVSLSRAMQEKDWIDAQKKMEAGEIFEAKVSGHNAGGLEVPFGKLRGFVPASHISTLPRNATPEERKDRLANYVGRTIPVKVVEVDRRRRRLIMSERAARRRWQREHRKQLLDELQVGEVRTGVVRSLSDFGVFIDLGGADGLVHISELAWFPVTHPSEVVKVGQEVEVKVLRVDKQRERIGLSIKRTQPDPWSRVEEDYHVGELVEAVVTRVVDFGAFVRLRTGVEGLLHVSEMADITPDHPQSLVSPGDLLLLRVLRIETERRRIGLSLRQVSETEWAEWAAKYHQRQAEEAAQAEQAQAAAEEAAVSEEELAYAPAASDEPEFDLEDQVDVVETPTSGDGEAPIAAAEVETPMVSDGGAPMAAAEVEAPMVSDGEAPMAAADVEAPVADMSANTALEMPDTMAAAPEVEEAVVPEAAAEALSETLTAGVPESALGDAPVSSADPAASDMAQADDTAGDTEEPAA